MTRGNTFKENNGIQNLVTIIAILSILRFLIEDYKDFGWIMRIPLSDIKIRDIIYFVLVIFINIVRSLIAYYTEKYSSDTFYKITNIIGSEILIVYVNIIYISHVYLSGWSIIVGTGCIAKIISLHLVMKDLRAKDKNITSKHLKIPKSKVKSLEIKNSNKEKDSLDLKSFLYFMIAPTLCYQVSFPKKTSRNYKKIFYKSFLFIIGLFTFVFVMDQYSIPSIYRIVAFQNFLVVVENIINLAISTAFIFLIFFLMVFVCALEIIAEITLFGEDQFYHSWWNSCSVAEFWSLWNAPVHNWFKKHVYIPALKNGYSKHISKGIVFLISAFFHEYVLSVSTKKLCGWVFFGMLMQIPLIYISDMVKYYIPGLSNYFFWGSFCVIGQPTIVILYYRSKYLLEMAKTTKIPQQ